LAEAVLVPQTIFSEEGKKTFFMDAAGKEFLHDRIPEWQIVNTYTFPAALYQLVNGANTKYIHTYTPLLKVYNGIDAQNQVSIDISPQQFRVLVKKEGQLLLAQTYSYAVPLDVIYYLLSIYQQFHLPKDETYLLLSGLVEEDSALYKELNNYFLNLHFNSAQSVTFDGGNLPPHYFTSILNTAACVL
jgi:hypothetical protein